MSLRAAIATVIKHGERTKMLIPAWATTYNVTLEEVRLEWERQMSEVSQKPTNAYEEPEGK